MPRTVVCHICGREFGTASIDIHIPQCAKKWEASEQQKPVAERRPVPQKPSLADDLSREEYNKAAQEAFNDQGMEKCPHCGRTFLSGRLEVHLRGCKPKAGNPLAAAGSGNGESSKLPSSHSPTPKPRAVVCHICGREFGSASIEIHLPQCAKKWEELEEKKTPSERRPVPQRPVHTGSSLEEYNKAAQEVFNDQGMMKCPNCGRTFLEDRLQVHLRSCKSRSAPQQEVDQSSEKEKRAAKSPKPRTVVCHICGREFGTASISIHMRKCAEKWEATEMKKEANERRPLPQLPSLANGLPGEEYNKLAQETFNEQGMMRCMNCGRTFLEDRLQVHMRSCKPAEENALPKRRAASLARPRSSVGCRNGEGGGSGGTPLQQRTSNDPSWDRRMQDSTAEQRSATGQMEAESASPLQQASDTVRCNTADLQAKRSPLKPSPLNTTGGACEADKASDPFLPSGVGIEEQNVTAKPTVKGVAPALRKGIIENSSQQYRGYRQNHKQTVSTDQATAAEFTSKPDRCRTPKMDRQKQQGSNSTVTPTVYSLPTQASSVRRSTSRGATCAQAPVPVDGEERRSRQPCHQLSATAHQAESRRQRRVSAEQEQEQLRSMVAALPDDPCSSSSSCSSP